MRIKKISPTTPANGNIENQYGTSQTNAYSEEYSNNTFASKNVENYSTTETRIGTWIDGKPLYRRFFTTDVSLPANAWTNLRYKSGEEAIVNCIYSDVANFNGACYPFLTRFSGNYIQTYAPVAVTIKSYYLEYTKTTD